MKRKSGAITSDTRSPKANGKQVSRATATPKPKLSSVEATEQFLAAIKHRSSSVAKATVNRAMNGETAAKTNQNTGDKQRSSASIMIVPRSVDTPCMKLSSDSVLSSQSEKRFVCKLCQKLVAPMKESAIRVHLLIYHSTKSDFRLCCGICRQFIGTEVQIETHHRKEHFDVENVNICKFIAPYVTTTVTQVTDDCAENAPNGDSDVISVDNKNCDVDNSDEDYVSANSSCVNDNQEIIEEKIDNNITENCSSDDSNFESIRDDGESLTEKLVTQTCFGASVVINNDNLSTITKSLSECCDQLLNKNMDIIEHNTDEKESVTDEQEYCDKYWSCDCGQTFISESSRKLHDMTCVKRPKYSVNYVMTSTPNNTKKILRLNSSVNESIIELNANTDEDLTDIIEERDKIWYCKCGKAFLTSLSFNSHIVLCSDVSRNSSQTSVCTGCANFANYTEIKDKINEMSCERIYTQNISVTEQQTISAVSEQRRCEKKIIIISEKLPPIDYNDERVVKSFLNKCKYNQNTANSEQNNTIVVNEPVVEKKLMVRVKRLPPLDYTDQRVVKCFLQKHNYYY